MIGAHLSSSRRMCSAVLSGVESMTTWNPSSVNRCCVRGCLTTALMATFRRLTMSRGVPAGASTTLQV